MRVQISRERNPMNEGLIFHSLLKLSFFSNSRLSLTVCYIEKKSSSILQIHKWFFFFSMAERQVKVLRFGEASKLFGESLYSHVQRDCSALTAREMKTYFEDFQICATFSTNTMIGLM